MICRKEKIAPNGPELSRIISGVMQWGIWGANLETEQISRLIADCCEMGVTSFDHADIYGRHTTEEAFGLAWKQTDIPREKIQLISKCGIKYPSRKKRDIKFKSYNTNASYIIQCVEDSLTNLQTEYLDVLLLHRPSPLMEPDEVAPLRLGLIFSQSTFEPAWTGPA